MIIRILARFAWGDNLNHTSFTYERTEDVDTYIWLKVRKYWHNSLQEINAVTGNSQQFYGTIKLTCPRLK